MVIIPEWTASPGVVDELGYSPDSIEESLGNPVVATEEKDEDPDEDH